MLKHYWFILEDGQPVDGEFHYTEAEIWRAVECADGHAEIWHVDFPDGKPRLRPFGHVEDWLAEAECGLRIEHEHIHLERQGL